MPYPSYTPQITSTTYCTVGYVNELNDNIKALMTDVYKAKGNSSTLKSFVRTTFTTTGTIKAGVIRHAILSEVQPDTHHNKIHGDNHTNGIDDIPVVTASRKGLLTTTLASKANSIATNATKNQLTYLTYTGNNRNAPQFVTVGFTPQFVNVLCLQKFFFTGMVANVGVGLWEAFEGASVAFFSIAKIDGLGWATLAMIGDWTHFNFDITNSIRIATNGFHANYLCNVSNIVYQYYAYRSN